MPCKTFKTKNKNKNKKKKKKKKKKKRVEKSNRKKVPKTVSSNVCTDQRLAPFLPSFLPSYYSFLPSFRLFFLRRQVLVGKKAKVVKTGVPARPGDDSHMSLAGYEIVGVDGGPAPPLSSQGLVMGNGAEARKTFKHFAPPFGALIESPYMWTIRPVSTNE